jgi:hypothetical protein
MDGNPREFKTRRRLLYIPSGPAKNRAMLRRLRPPALWGLSVLAVAAARAPAAPAGADHGRIVAAITEYTDAGRQVPPPTAGRPAWVLCHSGGQHDFGQPLAGELTLAPDTVQAPLVAALAADHYLPVAAGQAPTLLVIYSWGLHANVAADMEDPGDRNLLDRASLVAGQKFARELTRVLNESDLSLAATSTRPWGAQLPGMNPTTPMILQGGLSPLEAFRRRDPLTARLLDQIGDDCYYVIVAAYDYGSLARGERRLLWRTKLSLRAQGMSLGDAVTTLLASGTAYFGRDMAGPVLVPGAKG